MRESFSRTSPFQLLQLWTIGPTSRLTSLSNTPWFSCVRVQFSRRPICRSSRGSFNGCQAIRLPQSQAPCSATNQLDSEAMDQHYLEQLRAWPGRSFHTDTAGRIHTTIASRLNIRSARGSRWTRGFFSLTSLRWMRVTEGCELLWQQGGGPKQSFLLDSCCHNRFWFIRDLLGIHRAAEGRSQSGTLPVLLPPINGELPSQPRRFHLYFTAKSRRSVTSLGLVPSRSTLPKHYITFRLGITTTAPRTFR